MDCGLKTGFCPTCTGDLRIGLARSALDLGRWTLDLEGNPQLERSCSVLDGKDHVQVLSGFLSLDFSETSSLQERFIFAGRSFPAFSDDQHVQRLKRR